MMSEVPSCLCGLGFDALAEGPGARFHAVEGGSLRVQDRCTHLTSQHSAARGPGTGPSGYSCST